VAGERASEQVAGAIGACFIRLVIPFSSRLRQLVLTAHVVSSVGWLGAVAGFLVLGIAGLTSADPAVVRGAYLSMNLIGLFLIVPLSLVALLTGVAQSLGTQWGLLRYRWVLTKLVLTIGATFLLLLHQFTAVAAAARRAAESAGAAMPDVGRLGTQLVGDAALAIAVLLVTTTLSVYKPWGLTRYGRRVRGGVAQEALANDSGGRKVILLIVAALVAAVIVRHLVGGGIGRHGM
jgi:hypothetical protein